MGKEVSKQRNAKQKIGYIQLQFEKNCTRKKIHIQVCRRRLVLFLHNVTHIQLYIFPNPDPRPICLPIFNIWSEIFDGENAYMQEIHIQTEKAISIQTEKPSMLHLHFPTKVEMIFTCITVSFWY